MKIVGRRAENASLKQYEVCYLSCLMHVYILDKTGCSLIALKSDVMESQVIFTVLEIKQKS